jgi:hypothetical protein
MNYAGQVTGTIEAIKPPTKSRKRSELRVRVEESTYHVLTWIKDYSVGQSITLTRRADGTIAR